MMRHESVGAWRRWGADVSGLTLWAWAIVMTWSPRRGPLWQWAKGVYQRTIDEGAARLRWERQQ